MIKGDYANPQLSHLVAIAVILDRVRMVFVNRTVIKNLIYSLFKLKCLINFCC